MQEITTYDRRGVSSQKQEVHAAVANLEKGLFPGAFCQIFEDQFRPGYVRAMHNDGVGTKIILAYMYWKKTGDMSVWRGIAQDSFVMNSDDLLCAGLTESFEVTMSIDRNKHLIPGEVISTIIDECDRLCSWFTQHGIPTVYMGGETADVGDLVRTIVVNNTIRATAAKSDVIDAGRICAPAYIVGFSSTGTAVWENSYNFGLRSNGYTNGRHDLLSPLYRYVTELFSPETNIDLIYRGQFIITDTFPGMPEYTIGKALLSPTRTYLPLLMKLFQSIGGSNILGLIHCSGGGQTKCMKYGQPGIVYLKDALPEPPPMFQLLKAQNISWKEMYSTFNMGVGLEAVVRTKEVAQECIRLSKLCGIDAWITGQVLKNTQNLGRNVIIKNGIETITY